MQVTEFRESADQLTGNKGLLKIVDRTGAHRANCRSYVSITREEDSRRFDTERFEVVEKINPVHARQSHFGDQAVRCIEFYSTKAGFRAFEAFWFSAQGTNERCNTIPHRWIGIDDEDHRVDAVVANRLLLIQGCTQTTCLPTEAPAWGR